MGLKPKSTRTAGGIEAIEREYLPHGFLADRVIQEALSISPARSIGVSIFVPMALSIARTAWKIALPF
jgi:hypothetical protein